MALRKLTQEELNQLNPDELNNIPLMEEETPISMGGKLRKLTPGEVANIPPEELEGIETIPTKVPSIFTKFSGLVGEAASRLGKATGLPSLEEFGETVKLGTEEMERRGMKAVGEVPGGSEFTGFFGGLTGERIFSTAPLPEEAGMARQATVGAARLLGMGAALTPVGKVLRGAGVAAPIAGAITLGGYGALEKLPSDTSRLGHIAIMSALGAAFPVAGMVLQKVSSKIPEVGRIFSKIKTGETLTPGEEAVKKTVEIGQSGLLGGAAGITEGKTWEERVRNFFVGGLTFAMAHTATDAVGIVYGKVKNQKLPVGKKLEIEAALSNPKVSPMERRMAAKIIYNRVNAKYSVNRELWDEYVKEKINNNEPIDPLDFEKTLVNKAQEVIKERKLLPFTPEEGVVYGKGFEMREPKEPEKPEEISFTREGRTYTVKVTDEFKEYSKITQTIPEVKNEGQTLKSYIELVKQKPEFLRTAEEKILLESERPIESEIEVISAITPVKPEEVTGKPIELTAREVSELRAKKRFQEIITAKKEEQVGEIPILFSEKEAVSIPQEQSLRMEIKQQLRQREGDILKEVPSRVMIKESPEETEARNKISIIIGADIKNWTPEDRKIIKEWVLSKQSPLGKYYDENFKKTLGLILNAPTIERIGKMSPDELGQELKSGRYTNVIENVKTALRDVDTEYEVNGIRDVLINKLTYSLTAEGRKTNIESKIKDLLNKKIEQLRRGQFGRISGGLSYMQLLDVGRGFYREGKNTLADYRKAIKDYVGGDYPIYGESIVKSFREVSLEMKQLQPEGEGYRMAGKKVGDSDIETFKNQIQTNLKEFYNEQTEKFSSWYHKNMERAEDYIKGVPDKEREELLNKMSSNLGFGKYFMGKIREWIKVPLWDAELAPVIQGMRKIWTHRESEIRHEFLERLKFLKGKKISQDMKDAIFNTTLQGKPTGYDKLNPQERNMVEKIFDSTKWMWKQFEYEMRKNADDYKAITKRAGFDNVDDYITDYISKHSRPYYFPLIRGTGNYIVYAKDIKGNTIWAENFENTYDAKKRASELMEQLPDAKINMFDARERYGGFRMPQLIEMIHDLPYMRNILKSKEVAPELVGELEELLTGAYLKIWAKGRLAQREGIKGFSMDVINVLDRYAETFPRSFVRRLNSKRIARLVEAVPEDKQKYANNIVDYYLGMKDYEGNVNFAVRNLIFNWNLALKPSFAILNLSQRGTTTTWRAIKEVGSEGARIVWKSQRKELSFYKEIAQGKFKGMRTLDIIDKSNVLSKTEKDIIRRLHDTGELESLRNIEIIGKNRLSRVLNILATLSEKSNRLHSALTATEIGIKKGYRGEELFDYVTDFVHRTQWMYGKENRPVIGRGWRAMGFVFKTYMLNDLNFLKDLYPNKKVFAGAVATRLALGGLGGVYGAGAISDAVDWAMIHILGRKDWDLQKEETRNLMEDKYGKGLVDIITRGLPSMVGIEGSITFGSPELFDIAGIPLITGTWRNAKSILLERGIDWDEFIRRNVPTIVKHSIGFSTKTLFGKEKITTDDLKHLPPEIRKRAMEIYQEMPKSLTGMEKILYSIGFSTKTPTEYYNALNAIKGSAREVKHYKAGIHREIGKALAEGRRDDIKNLLEDAKERGLKVNMSAVMRQLKIYKESETEETEEEE